MLESCPQVEEGRNYANFTERAKKEVVEENRKRRHDLKARIAHLDEMLENLG